MIMSKLELEQCIKRRGMDSSITAQKYTDEINQLFLKWKKAVDTKGTPFITDGVMDPEKWFDQRERPLFLLKEAYGGTEDWDLAADHVLCTSSGKSLPSMWTRISRWTYGMLTSEYKLPGRYQPDAKVFKERGNKFVRSIAAINIKKYCGKEASDYEEIMEYAIKDAEYLREQIRLCDPTVIVCGYTAGALAKLFDFGKTEHGNTEYYYHFELNGHEVLVIDYYHPANHFPEIMNYFTLTSIYGLAKADQYRRFCDDIQKQRGKEQQ